jgi:hypothetical protein
MHCTWERGAVSGALDLRFRRALAASRCRFGWPGTYVMAHSRNNGILEAIRRANAFLSRLEGEWRARFYDPQWSRLIQPGKEPERTSFPAITGRPEGLPA